MLLSPLPGGAAEEDFSVHALEEEGGGVARLGAETERGLEVDDEGAVEADEGRRGEEALVGPERQANHERWGIFDEDTREVTLGAQSEDVPCAHGHDLLGCADAWQLGGENPYRHKDAEYFLTSENEWYKAAYYNPGGSNYFLYPTASSSVPTAVASGTNAETVVYNNVAAVPAIVDSAGGLSLYGTMGQGGNVFEWNESALDGTNSSSSENRAISGGEWANAAGPLRSSSRYNSDPTTEQNLIGFRVASVPEPSTAVLVLMAGGAWLLRKRFRRSL